MTSLNLEMECLEKTMTSLKHTIAVEKQEICENNAKTGLKPLAVLSGLKTAQIFAENIRGIKS